MRRWVICPECFFAIPAEDHADDGTPHQSPWTGSQCSNRDSLPVFVPYGAAAILRELVEWGRGDVIDLRALETIRDKARRELGSDA